MKKTLIITEWTDVEWGIGATEIHHPVRSVRMFRGIHPEITSEMAENIHVTLLQLIYEEGHSHADAHLCHHIEAAHFFKQLMLHCRKPGSQ